MHKRSMGFLLAATVATTLAGPVLAQATAGNGTSSREMQRGVPGTDVDLKSNQKASRNGVPGVDVDVGNARKNNGVPGVDVDTRTSQRDARNGMPGVDVDTRASGAGPAGSSDRTGQRAARADRN